MPEKRSRDNGDLGNMSHIRRGLMVLEQLATKPATAAEVGRLVNVNRSSALRILGDLVDAGYVTRDDATKEFTIRPERFYGLIVNHPAHEQLIERVGPLLKRLTAASGEASLFAAPASGNMVYVQYQPSSEVLTLRERLGTVRPIHCSAVGRAYLSTLDDTALDEVLGTLNYSGGTESAPKGPLELRQRVEEARNAGFALDLDETLIGASCVAAPLNDHGRCIGSIALSGPTSRMPQPRLIELGALIVHELTHTF
ncbi:IclR family transcriptional regulator [Sphaerisporangium krabiense]|uniref:IclR family acetate operon transcriptional repressor n=1 Tax=Sphaerisporangium krabiense TaxID=763782 RepID=A0A7W9DQR0_9ACTN|nr:IclR family transcriptional regulator [Sphaerisporangium krabiense]MBB5626695.1 IclR family acetate operon transcriptional repressor [Sphaerisporangium krabiense]GII63614.1 IclR family transcriptional regulator [Sphaerisporangium krabiense]